MRKIGFRMQMAADYVAANPGCSVHAVSVAIGPHGSSHFGREAVLRAEAAGLIERRPHPTREGWWQCFVPEDTAD